MNEAAKKTYKSMIMFASVVLGVALLYFSLHIGAVQQTAKSENFFSLCGLAFQHIEEHPFELALSLYSIGAFVVFAFIAVFIGLWVHTDNQINVNTPNSGGSAKWNTGYTAYNKKYTDPPKKKEHNGDNNMILTQNVFLSMNTRQTLRNNNVLVVGGSGAGKSRFMVKPNLLQANCNYVITDPAGELLESTGKFLENQGYEIKVFNLVEMSKSDRYNPFAYIRDDVGVLMMINCLIKNTNPVGQTGGDPFWEKSETALLQALVFYLIKYRPKYQQNFTSVMKLLRAAEVDENDSTKKSKLDRIFDEIQATDPNSIALKQYLTFKMGAGKTLKSILISTSVRLTVFNMKQIENLTKEDSIDLGKMGEGKKALFVIIPAADSTYNFLVSMMYSQLFETLYFVAETKYEGKRLKRPVRFMLDEFANIGQIPEFTKKLATMRKYEISCTIILQNLAQIKTMYEKDWESIIGNCDSFLFLGGQEYSTLEYISKELGKQTIKTRSNNRSHGKSSSAGSSTQATGRELMTPDEIMRMPNSDCILMIRGLYPFYDKKFDYTNHERYKLTGDADKKFLYVNLKDNSDFASMAELEIEYSKHKAAQYAKALSGNDTNAIISEPMNINSFVNSLSLDDIDEIRTKIVIIGPDDLQQMKPSQKEQHEQEVVAEVKKRKKKKKREELTKTSIQEEKKEIESTHDIVKSNQTSSDTSSSNDDIWDNADFADF